MKEGRKEGRKEDGRRMSGWVGGRGFVLISSICTDRYVRYVVYVCIYVWRMGTYGLAGRGFFLVLLALDKGGGMAASSRDCALRVMVCDEAGFSVEM